MPGTAAAYTQDMRRIITLALLALTVSAGSAMADHRDRGDRSRDHRSYNNSSSWRRQTPVASHDHRSYNNTTVRVQPTRRYVERRRPVYQSNNRFVFNGGISYNYRRPVITRRYTDYRYRPQILIENYQPVTGYVWSAGQWQWNGYEWSWIAGHYDLDASYQYPSEGYYDNGGYNSGYDNTGYNNTGYNNTGYDNYYQSPVSNDPCDD